LYGISCGSASACVAVGDAPDRAVSPSPSDDGQRATALLLAPTGTLPQPGKSTPAGPPSVTG
jgi:hypothetical protein